MNDIFEIMGGKNQNGSPQFPGMQKGASIADIRTLIKKQKRVKGYIFSIANGNSSLNLNLSGTARLFLGFAILLENDVATSPDDMTLTINNEIVIDQVPPSFFTPDFTDEEYYFIPRPLSGTDEIILSVVNSQAIQNMRIAVYYI